MKSIAFIVAAVVVWASAAAQTHAGLIPNLANGGSERPYSDLLDYVPLPSHLFRYRTLLNTHLDPPSPIGNATDLAEPGLGNPNSRVLGHVVEAGPNLYGVWDRLARIPVVHPLHFDPSRAAGLGTGRPMDNVLRRSAVPGFRPSASGVRGGGGSGASQLQPSFFILPEAVPVPEPSTGGLLLLSGAGLIARRGQRQCR